MAIDAGHDVAVDELSEGEARENFDRAARHYLGMSGDAFRDAWNAGTFKDDPEQPGVQTVAMLLPLVR